MASIPVRISLITVALGLLAGCAGLSDKSQSVPIDVPTDVAVYLHDELFPGQVTAELLDANSYLELSENYRQQLDRLVLPIESEYDRYVALRRWMFRTFDSFEFDVTETYSVGGLNTQRKINCLSFSVVYVAAARYAGVPADFQLVNAPPYWDVENASWVNNQHINVSGVIKLDADFFSGSHSARWQQSNDILSRL